MSQHSGSPSQLSLTEVEVLGLLVDGADSGEIASALGRPREEVMGLVGLALRNMGALELGDHPHMDPMDDDQLLAHVRLWHLRDVPRFRSVESGEILRLHLLMHGESPPSTA